MILTCFDPAINQLSEIEKQVSSNIEVLLHPKPGVSDDWERRTKSIESWKKNQRVIKGWKRELSFLKMTLCCFETWDYGDAELNANLRSMLIDVEDLWKVSEISTYMSNHEGAAFKRKIQQSRQMFEECCEGDLLCFSLLIFRRSDSLITREFLHLILHNLEDLLSYKDDEIVPFWKEVGILQQKLMLMRDYFELAVHGCLDCKEIEDFRTCVHTFANRAAYVVFLCWIKDADEETTGKLNLVLSSMHGVRDCYFGVLKAIILQQSNDTIVLGRTMVDFIDLLLENQVPSPCADRWQGLQEGRMLLSMFMADPPKESVQDQKLTIIFCQIDVLLREGSFLFLLLNDMREDLDKESTILCDFVTKLDMIKGKIREMYNEIRTPSLCNFPRTNGIGFLDFLLQNLEKLKEKMNKDIAFIPFAKTFVTRIEKELLSLRPFLNGIFQLQKDGEEFKDTWYQVIDLAYQTEHVINACSVLLHPIWYHMASLYDILEQIEATKQNLEKVKSCKIYNIGVLPSLASESRPLERTSYPTTSDEIIGFDKEAKMIIDELIGGSQSLNIISIIGMAGLGKTTLATKVYNSRSVKRHFHETSFCYVSQVNNTERLLLDILKSINKTDDDFSCMKKDDLAHKLWQCLSGKRYVVVLDDIWDVCAWDEIKGSFPLEQYGSRVIFTTRNHKVASEAKSSHHKLDFLSEDESFELLQRKTFGRNGFPQTFVEVAKTVSQNCKGLPLAIVIVAGLLSSSRTSLSWWKEIAKTSSSFSWEGCRDIIGLSYKNLPENLKSCFLYLSMYREDELIQAKEMEQLWMGEGFVYKSGMKSLRKEAKQYINDLVDRNLVIAVKRTLGGRIRTLRLHDLVHEFCKTQAQEDNFMWLKDVHKDFSSSKSAVCNRYRVCYPTDEDSLDDIKQNMATSIHSLLDLSWNAIKPESLRDLKLVQVFHFRYLDWETLSNEFQLADLLHLRYIHVKDHSEEPLSVPESFFNLWNLETLIFCCDDAGPIQLPKTIWKMRRLRHLEFVYCKLEVPEGCCQLDNMESFSRLCLYDHRTAREILQRLPNIQKLGLWLDGSKWTNQIFAIDFLSKLESLDIAISKPDLLVRFPSTLKRLVLHAKPSTELLSTISELPFLQVMKFKGSLKQWLVEGNKFQKLKYLQLNVENLEQWDASDDSFPCLEQLVLRKCEMLEEIPAFFGELPTLQGIRVFKCSDKVKSSAIQIHEEQIDGGKILELEIK